MSTVTESLDARVPVSTVYDPWTRFASFPEFMQGVEEIRRLDDAHLRWRTGIGGVTREFGATVSDQHREERVAWASDAGPRHAGVITFHRIDDAGTAPSGALGFPPVNIALYIAR